MNHSYTSPDYIDFEQVFDSIIIIKRSNLIATDPVYTKQYIQNS